MEDNKKMELTSTSNPEELSQKYDGSLHMLKSVVSEKEVLEQQRYSELKKVISK
jgi:hypothetical protein